MAGQIHILWAGTAPSAHVDALNVAGSVAEARELLDAMRLSNEIDFDAAVIDVEQLSEGAFTLLRHLRARTSRRYMPIFFWSSGGATDERVKAFAAGADDWVHGSIDAQELLARLMRGLGLRLRIDGLLDETERLYELSLTDGLTQVANHRHFQERLRDEFRRAQRYDDPLALVLLDLDHFKDVNDKHGHVAGDQVLRDVASAIKKSVRETDFVARYGGEEFAVVLPKTQLAGALTVAERVWADVAKLPLGGANGASFHVTASLGLAGYPSRSVASAEQLVRCADEALYRAKREGRNKIAIYQASSFAEAV
ncbi:MAG: diguanylate cyclase [Myxococcaceae bacterium]|nr:diguanylate cyclase [Myxococcaceae bacterium]